MDMPSRLHGNALQAGTAWRIHRALTRFSKLHPGTVRNQAFTEINDRINSGRGLLLQDKPNLTPLSHLLMQYTNTGCLAHNVLAVISCPSLLLSRASAIELSGGKDMLWIERRGISLRRPACIPNVFSSSDRRV